MLNPHWSEFAILILLAPIVGSFLGVLIVRMPNGENVIFGRSVCAQCNHPLRWYDLVPIVNWVWLRGHCRDCSQPIDKIHLYVEGTSIGVVFWAASITSGIALIASCILGWILLTLAIIDQRHYLLPDQLNFALGGIGLIATYLFDASNFAGHLLGISTGFIAFAGLSWAYRYIRAREGLGLGDAKLLAALGAWVSWEGLPSIIFIAAALALCTAIVRSVSGKPLKPTDRIAFGPFIAMGGWIVWLYGPLTHF